MKNVKRIISLLLCALIFSTLFCLTACGGEATYKVNVKDPLGNPYTEGIVVGFIKDGTQVAIDTVDESGTAEKTLAKGRYNVTLKFADDSPCYFDESLHVTPSQKEIDAVLTRKVSTEPKVIFAGEGEHNAYSLEVGCTHVDLKENSRNYFLFTPKEAGNYEFSVVNNADTLIGYYGSTHFVQENSAAEVADNKFSLSITQDMIGDGIGGTSVLVVGVDSLKSGVTNCDVAIVRTGDPEKTLADEPWTIYEKTV